ncbi:MAG TPA: helix-turn-helix domain-containing protein [Nitrospira sp.]|nr:helix-turn-helix domain-containing protein [Nitrospira sp.]
MPTSSPTYHIVLLTTDPTVKAQVRQIFTDAAISIFRDAATFQQELPSHRVDIIIEELPHPQGPVTTWSDHLDVTHTLFIQGSPAVLRQTLSMIQPMFAPSNLHLNKAREGSLENYLEVKMGEFVKGMRNGSARNLHPILISAVERPLITSALQETRGNQIQAAELLGLNRNTLRKKIVNLHIPLKQTKLRANRSV